MPHALNNALVFALAAMAVLVVSLVPWALLILLERLTQPISTPWGVGLHWIGLGLAALVLMAVALHLAGGRAGVWDKMVRWRTWLVNAGFAALITPDVLMMLLGYDWVGILPPQLLPYVTLANVLLNLLMRPRPAVRAGDPEADMRMDRLGRGQ